MGKEAYYFSHDSNAKNDPKIMAMISEYGMEGYGRFWVIIEMLREQESFELPLKKYVINALAMQTHCNADALQCYLDACINEYELFESDGENFWSNSLKRRMEKRNDKSEKAKKAAEARWNKTSNTKGSKENKNKRNADAMRTHSESNASAMPKGKEKKEKESKRKENNNTRKSQIYDDDSIEYQLASRLYQKILENNKNFKKPDLQKWADDIRLMIERDSRTAEQIEYLIDWVQQDSFWKANILSTSKLRKQFDRLVIIIKEDQAKKERPRGQVVNMPNMPYAYQSMQDWANEEDET